MMHYLALATDYDCTLATDGRVEKATIKALRNFRQSGRKLILVTGRELSDLIRSFPEHDLFDRIVAENGALLYTPATKRDRLLGERPNKEFVCALERLKIEPLHIGRSIVSTHEPNEMAILQTIRKLGLELQVIFNKGAVMVLPPGVNKESGLKEALSELGLCLHNAVAIGDAENDHALLSHAGCSAAVGNALDTLKVEADIVTEEQEGAGVVELIEMILKDDLQSISRRIKRHQIYLGKNSDEDRIRFNARVTATLVAGPSGSGKTTVATAILERVARKGYQFCIIDPEGDYDQVPNTVRVGDPRHVPMIEEVMDLLEHFENPVVNLLALPLADRPPFFIKLFGKIQELRETAGHPHWLVIDEVHHLLPKEWRPSVLTHPQSFTGTLLVTVHPDKVSSTVLAKVDLILAVGDLPGETIERFSDGIGKKTPAIPRGTKKKLDVIAWFRTEGEKPFLLSIEPGTLEHDRHRRKYAHGNLEEDAFFFQGPAKKLNLRAQNLDLFIQLGRGVDDETWIFHLKNHDYSSWIRKAIQDDELAQKIEKIENKDLSPQRSRDEVIAIIEKTYTAAA